MLFIIIIFLVILIIILKTILIKDTEVINKELRGDKYEYAQQINIS